jgi:hypothetical protein
VDARDKRGHDESGMAIFASETSDFEFQTATYLPATEFRPSDPKASSLQKQRAQGKPGASLAPAALRVKRKNTQAKVTTGSPNTFRPSLHEWF